ncbi:MAG TPA: glycosyltransferase family 39 protein [Blastocatellia bacterium]|nr:glycosyltransferase family 39 protein [Blastocatellia bacterium]
MAEPLSSDEGRRDSKQSGASIPTSSKVFGAGISAALALAAYGVFLKRGVAPAVVGYNLVPAERVLGGQIPYRDFLYNYTPGVLWLNAAVFRCFGTSLITARAGVFAAKAATAALLYLVGAHYISKRAALLPVLMMLAWIGYGDLLKVFPTQYGMPLLLGAWLCILNAFDSVKGRGQGAWLAGAGALAGAVLIFKQNVGVFAFGAAAGSAVVAGWPFRWAAGFIVLAIKRLAFVVAGFAVPVAGLCLYLGMHHAFTTMLSHFSRHAVAYEEAKGIALPGPSVLLSSLVLAAAAAGIAIGIARVSRRWSSVFLGGAFAALAAFSIAACDKTGVVATLYQSLVAEVYYLPIFASVGAVALLLWARGNGASEWSPRVLAGIFFALAAFLEIFPRSDADHLARVLPASFVLGYALLATRWRHCAEVSAASPETSSSSSLRRNRESIGARCVLLAGACLLTIILGVRVSWAPQFEAGPHFRDRTSLLFERGGGVMDTPAEAKMLNDVVSYIQDSTSPGDQILAVSRKTTSLYFFAARPNTTRVSWFDSPGIPEADREDIYSRVAARQFKLIIFGTDLPEMTGTEKNEISRYQKRLLSLLPENYNQTAIIDGITCFAPK